MAASVLIVEDNATTREALTGILRSAGYGTAEAADGREALAYLRGHSAAPALILLDLMMPVMDGWEFLRERRKEPALAAVPVVLFTAAGGIDGPGAWALGAADTLHKPADPDDLLAAVGRYC